MFVYFTIHDSIRYTIQKNQKSINDTIHDLTTITHSTNDSQITKSLKDFLKLIQSLTPIAMSFEQS